MEFTGKENHDIDLEAARKMTAAFRGRNPNMTKASFFGRDAIQAILAQEGCTGIRIYGGEDSEGKMSPVLVGVTAEGRDLFDGTLAELGGGCPPYCDEGSPLFG